MNDCNVRGGALIGKSEYLFLWQGHQKQFSYLIGELTPSDESVANFKNNLKNRKKICDDLGIEFKHLVFPSKPLIKSSFLPDGMLVESLYRRCYSCDGVVYPIEELRLAESERSTFRVLDTHMTDFGSLTVLKAVLPEYYERFQSLGGVFHNTMHEMSGDLWKMASPDEPKTVKEVKITPRDKLGRKFYSRNTNNFSDLSGNAGGVAIYYTPDSVYAKRLLIFGDSFSLSLVHLLTPIFREIIYIRSEVFKSELVFLYRPDMVISASAERYLAKVNPDISSHFMFYEDIFRASYKPEVINQKFSESFQAFTSRVYNKLYHKNFVSNLKASIYNDKLSDLLKLNLLYNARVVLEEIISIKPENQVFLQKLESLNKSLNNYDIKLPTIKCVQKYASQMFISNIRATKSSATDLNIDFRGACQILMSAFENISVIDIDEKFIDVETGARIIFTNMCVISDLISNKYEISTFLAELFSASELTILYKLLLASYLFDSALRVHALLQSKLLQLDAANFERNLEEHILKSIFLEKEKFESNQEVLNEKDIKFGTLIRNKSIAIVGPANVDGAYGKEIDEFDVVVRLSYIDDKTSISDPERYGAKTNVSYFSAHLRFFEENMSSLSSLVDFVCITLPKFTPEALAYDNFRETIKYDCGYIGKPNLIQACLLEALLFSPKRVKIFCSNLFLTRKTYNDSYPSVKMLNTVTKGGEHRGINSITFTNHDPVINFFILKVLYEKGIVECDPELCSVLEKNAGTYMHELQEIYG